jgi:hypothetical protein
MKIYLPEGAPRPQHIHKPPAWRRCTAPEAGWYREPADKYSRFNALLEAVRGDKVKHKIAHELDVFVAFVAVGPTVNLNVGSEGAGLRIQAALVIGDGLAIVANAADRVIEFGGTRIEAVQLHT